MCVCVCLLVYVCVHVCVSVLIQQSKRQSPLYSFPQLQKYIDYSVGINQTVGDFWWFLKFHFIFEFLNKFVEIFGVANFSCDWRVCKVYFVYVGECDSREYEGFDRN